MIQGQSVQRALSEAAEVVAAVTARPGNAPVGLDTETCPLPQHRAPRQIIRLTGAGAIAKAQCMRRCQISPRERRDFPAAGGVTLCHL